MDISLEDLDYMGITILGHRKTILKGIEEIGSVKQVFIPPVASVFLPSNLTSYLRRQLSAPSAAPARAAVSASVDFEAAQQSSRKPVHWSHAEPIANNKVCGT